MTESNQSSDTPSVRSLAVLRGLIDTLDHEVLALLSRRNALVSEIAQYKREHEVPIRDFVRERAILDDRRARATPLGLSAELTESLFRLILRGSRDRQASLKVELPLELDQKSVAIIGGCGANAFVEAANYRCFYPIPGGAVGRSVYENPRLRGIQSLSRTVVRMGTGHVGTYYSSTSEACPN